MKVCGKCGLEKESMGFPKRSRSRDGLAWMCRDCNKEYLRPYHSQRMQDLRARVFDKLGHCCIRCGFADKRALQIDHVNGDGYKTHRKMSAIPFLESVLNDTTNAFQILCANCNWIKRSENREYIKRV